MREKGFSIALDVVGAIPGLGNMVSASAASARAIDGIISYGGGAHVIATSFSDDPYGTGTAGVGLGLALSSTAFAEGAKAIPLAGNVFSGLTGLYDIYAANKIFQKCMGF